MRQRVSPSSVLCVAGVLFVCAAGALVAVAWKYAKAAPGSATFVERVTRQAGEWRSLHRRAATSMEQMLAGEPDAAIRAVLDAQASTYPVVGYHTRAIAALDAGARESARALLTSGEYRAAERQMDADLTAFVEAIRDLGRSRFIALALLAVTLAVLFAGALVWCLAWRAVRSHERAARQLAVELTERLELQEQLRHAQKMEAIGQLAGGIAHDFNNLLTVIVGNTEMLTDERPLSPAGAHRLDEIRTATASAAAVTRQLLVFSHKSKPASAEVDVNQCLAHVERLISRLIGERIRIAARLHPDAGAVVVDHEQLQQAVINLALNARDAMPSGGALTLETSVTSDLQRTLVTVRDSGHGIDDAIKERIFEPFFTTKDPGKGTGLGLSMVYGFVRQAGGTVRADSQVGRGTTITIELPRVAVRSDAAAAADLPPRAASGGEECVLVVEDQASVRAMVGSVLRGRGFRVSLAASAREARAVLAAHHVDVVLTDIVMAGESGIELAEWLRVTHPRIRVLLMSGHRDHPALDARPLPDNVPLLPKPFTPSMLLTQLRATLDCPARGQSLAS